MKQYVIDEIRTHDFDNVKRYLDDRLGTPGIEGVYWKPVDENLLSDHQKAHTDCQPFYFAITLEEYQLSCELLVRTRERMSCDCMAYATEKQRNWIIRWLDNVFEELQLHS